MNFRALFGLRFDLELSDFNFRLAWRVRMKDSSIPAAINDKLGDKVVLVEQPAAEARNSDKKSFWIASFSFALPQ